MFQLIDVDTFDDDMGIVSLLNYFLSERHSFYIDIHWRENDLSHMQLFLSAMMSFISTCNSDVNSPSPSQSTVADYNMETGTFQEDTAPWEALQVTGLKILHATLWTFPPHRVVGLRSPLRRSAPTKAMLMACDRLTGLHVCLMPCVPLLAI